MAIREGLRLPLLIDGGMIVAGIVTVTLLYSDVNQLKADQAQQVPAERVARIEEKLTAVNKTLDEMQRQQREDMKRLLDALTDKRSEQRL